MRKIILWMSVSLDGYIAGPNGELDWHMVDEELHQYFNDELKTMSAFLEGRVVHELMADFWPTADTRADSTPPMIEYAAIWREMPKFVFSTTLDHADWNATVVNRVDLEEITALKTQPGGDMTVGGADLAASFLHLDLIDEYRIFVHPVLIGRGRPLFAPSDRTTPLRLASTRTFGNGVVLLQYERG